MDPYETEEFDDEFYDDDYDPDEDDYVEQDDVDAAAQHAYDRHIETVSAEAQIFENRLGRALTHREITAIAEGSNLQFARGQSVDIGAAIEHELGVSAKRVEDMDAQEHVAFMVSRMTDGQPSAEERAPDEVDLDDDGARQAFMVARMEGVAYDDAVINDE